MTDYSGFYCRSHCMENESKDQIISDISSAKELYGNALGVPLVDKPEKRSGNIFISSLTTKVIKRARNQTVKKERWRLSIMDLYFLIVLKQLIIVSFASLKAWRRIDFSFM